MTQRTRRTELREFLRARRRALLPEAVGIPRGRRRRVPGLRREELAALAGVGVTWYTWLEQGREIRVAMDTLERVARALRLSPSDALYLYALCRPAPPGTETLDTAVAATPGACVPQPVLDVLDSFTGPALVLGPATNVLAANAFADALYELDAFPGPFPRNLLARMFLDPTRRQFYVDYEVGLRNLVGTFRLYYGRHAGEPYVEALCDYLRARSPAFVRVWDEQGTALPTPVALRLCSERFGHLRFSSVRFATPDLPEHLVVLLAPADAATREVVAGWHRGGGAGNPAA